MIYFDGVHLVTDGPVQELHSFAEKAGLPRRWFENKRGKLHPHYDVFGMNKINVVQAGAKCVRPRELAVILQNSESVK